MCIFVMFFFFFFQAEDGIRDGRVTGVQTCALPILGGGAGEDRQVFVRCPVVDHRMGQAAFVLEVEVRPIPEFADRSEERRVGKECRSRWSADDYKKKNTWLSWVNEGRTTT